MLGVEAGINSQPFAIFVTPKQRKMNIRKRFGTLRSRLGVEFQCPHCHSNNINNKHITPIRDKHADSYSHAIFSRTASTCLTL